MWPFKKSSKKDNTGKMDRVRSSLNNDDESGPVVSSVHGNTLTEPLLANAHTMSFEPADSHEDEKPNLGGSTYGTTGSLLNSLSQHASPSLIKNPTSEIPAASGDTTVTITAKESPLPVLVASSPQKEGISDRTKIILLALVGGGLFTGAGAIAGFSSWALGSLGAGGAAIGGTLTKCGLSLDKKSTYVFDPDKPLINEDEEPTNRCRLC